MFSHGQDTVVLKKRSLLRIFLQLCPVGRKINYPSLFIAKKMLDTICWGADNWYKLSF